MPELPPPLSWAVSDWAGDRWAGGAWSRLLVGGTAADRARLGEPVADRLVLAGEAVHSTWAGHGSRRLWDICWATPASPPPTRTHTSRSTPWSAGCYRIFTETASGARTDRPALEQFLDQVRPGDTLVVWKLDRLGRSLASPGRHGHRPGRVWVGVPEPAGGDRHHHHPGGKLVFHVFAALAESNAT
jgi:hypothetical protein